MSDLDADRTTRLYNTRHPFHPSRVGGDGGGLLQSLPKSSFSAACEAKKALVYVRA
jgi:hypothetical protein